MSFEVAMTLPCTKCNSEKPIVAFRKRSGRSERGRRLGRWSHCKQCESDYANSPRGRAMQRERGLKCRRRFRERDYHEYRRREREQNLRRKYGFGHDEYERLSDKQNGLCAICHTEPTRGRGKRLHIDHDHETGAIRGLLCGMCNVSLGGFDDDVQRLRNAIAYLKSTGSGS